MNPVTQRYNTLELWRQNLNSIGNNVGDPANIYSADGADNFSHPSTDILVAAINDLNTRKVKRSGDTIASLTVTGALSGSTASFSGQITSTLAIGTAPLVVTSTTQVANLNASLLIGGTWTAPGTIGSGTANTGAFTTLSATGQITSTVTTGTAPFVVASTTQVSNLNASYLIGGTWAIPGSIGLTTPNAGAFTTLAASGDFAIAASKFTVASGTGNTVAAGSFQSASLTVTGSSTLAATTATTPAVDNNSTNVATTAYYVGQASATSPVMDGTATIGTSLKWAHADHIHPTDTSRSPVASPAFTGTIGLNSIVDVQTATVTTTSTTPSQVVASFATATYQSAEFIVQAVDATGAKYHSVTIKAVHDGTTAASVEYAAIATANGLCGTFTVDVNTGNLRLLTTPSSANSTVFKVVAILSKV